MKSFKKIFNILLVAQLLSNLVVAQPERTALDQLDKALQKKANFTEQKQSELIALKAVHIDQNDLLGMYHHNGSLLHAYLKFNFDSALLYATRNLKIAKSLKREDLAIESSLNIANLYFSLDKFLEANDILKHINSKSLSKTELEQYLIAQIEFYQHYLANNQNDSFNTKVNLYRDSLLQIADQRSITFYNNWALKNIRLGKLLYAEKYLQGVLKLTVINTADHAMVSYLLAMDYELQGRKTEAIRYYSLSAAEDVRLSIKDNAAIQSLALLLYGTGDIDHAYSCTQSAIEDALFCGAKFRTLQMSNFYAIINTAYLQKEARGKNLLIRYLLLISILSLFLTLAVIYVYKQMKRESRIKTELKATTDQLAELNERISESNSRLNEVNVQLFEANKIKETYIANFFDLCSAYINKLESFRKLVNKKAAEQPENLLKMLRSTSIVENEVDELYKTFDKVFLSLYPNFISEFNELLLPTERINHKPQGELSTELRIYALIRLGITDSAQIAGFLRYSRSTIYNYRTSARNKAAGSRDLFEENVMKISSIHSLS